MQTSNYVFAKQVKLQLFVFQPKSDMPLSTPAIFTLTCWRNQGCLNYLGRDFALFHLICSFWHVWSLVRTEKKQPIHLKTDIKWKALLLVKHSDDALTAATAAPVCLFVPQLFGKLGSWNVDYLSDLALMHVHGSEWRDMLYESVE